MYAPGTPGAPGTGNSKIREYAGEPRFSAMYHTRSIIS